MANEQTGELVGELRAVKLLLVLQLLAIGYKQKHIAAALSISEATLSRMLPKGLAKEIAKLGTKSEVGSKES